MPHPRRTDARRRSIPHMGYVCLRHMALRSCQRRDEVPIKVRRKGEEAEIGSGRAENSRTIDPLAKNNAFLRDCGAVTCSTESRISATGLMSGVNQVIGPTPESWRAGLGRKQRLGMSENSSPLSARLASGATSWPNTPWPSPSRSASDHHRFHRGSSRTHSGLSVSIAGLFMSPIFPNMLDAQTS